MTFKKSIKTQIEEAELFANESGADAMAISVGNTHFHTKKIAKRTDKINNFFMFLK